MLLDANVLIWFLGNSDRLDDRLAAKISDRANDVLVSAATTWEMSIKSGLGKLEVPDDLPEALEASGFHELPVRWSHTEAVGALPPHHRDPFDRMLVAQAQVEGLTIATADPQISRYDVSIIGPA